MSFSFIWRRKNDNRLAAKVRTTYLIGSVEIAMILAGWDEMRPDVWHFDDGHSGRDPSRAAVEEYVRLRLYLDGAGTFDDNWPEEDSRADHNETIARWAVNQIRRLYPDLDEPALANWLKGFEAENAKYQLQRARWRQQSGGDEGFDDACALGYIDEEPQDELD